MNQFYIDPSLENDPHALPDGEVFYRTRAENTRDEWWNDDGSTIPAGWFYWFCVPGYPPDGDPIGPFETEAEAIADARGNA